MNSEFDNNIDDIDAIVHDKLDFKTRYSDLEVIGKGAMGKVFRAYDKKLAKVVAIKFLHSQFDPDTVLRFQQEARALSKLNHQFIVKVFDFQLEDDELFLVMEYVEGKSLESILKEKGKLPFADAIHYTMQLCNALEHAHSNEIVHRDLKPSNVLINVNNNVRILDFGIAKLLQKEDHFGTLTRPGQMIGTPLYMSPEQVRGEAADARSDIFGLGMMLYAMLAGHVPWEEEQVVVIFREKLAGEVPPVKTWIGDTKAARELDRIVAIALRSDPDQRFQTMSEFREALSEVAIEPVEVKQAAKPIQNRPNLLTRKNVLFVGVICSFASGALFLLYSIYADMRAPIKTTPENQLAHFSSQSPYGVVEPPVGSPTAKSPQPQKHTTIHNKRTNEIPGFFKQTEIKEQLDFWFAQRFVDDEMLSEIDPRIDQLSLDGNKRFTDAGLRSIPVRQLVSIDLTETNINDDTLKTLAGMKNLTWIRLDRTVITDSGIKYLAPLGKQLVRLDVDQCRGFTDSGLKYVLNTFPNLFALHIGDTSVTSSGIKLLGAHRNLRELWLSSLRTTDDDVKVLESLDLVLLDLSGCPQITDKIFDILDEQPHLSYFEMGGCPKITASGVAKWKKRHPHAIVHWQDAKEADILTESGLIDAPEQLE